MGGGRYTHWLCSTITFEVLFSVFGQLKTPIRVSYEIFGLVFQVHIAFELAFLKR